MELRQLRYLVALAEERHFGRAARRAHIAPSAFSAQIARLEEELGTPLVGRTSRRVWLTDAGTEVVAHAREVLAATDALVASAGRASRAIGGALRVGLSAVALDLTADILGAYRERHPEVRVELVHAPFVDPSAGLVAGTVDAALVWAPYDSRGQVLHPLRQEARAVILPAGHPLAGRELVQAADVLGEPWVDVPSPDLTWRAFWTLHGMRDGTAPRSIGSASTPDGVVEVVAAGGGVAMLPVSLAGQLRSDRVVAVPVADAPPCQPSVALPSEPSPAAVAFDRVALDVAGATRQAVGDRALAAHDRALAGR